MKKKSSSLKWELIAQFEILKIKISGNQNELACLSFYGNVGEITFFIISINIKYFWCFS